VASRQRNRDCPLPRIFDNIDQTLLPALRDTLEEFPTWVRAGTVILSGFHSPLEQQVLRSVLRRHGRVVKVLARGMAQYHPPELELGPLEQGRMLVLSAFPEQIQRTTRETSLARNRLVLALATDLIIPHLSPNGGLAAVVAEMRPDGLENSDSLTNQTAAIMPH
jgi:predicted Rossmann fold nucleotide-binding protein DprA/Smf involved in DNA uptake